MTAAVDTEVADMAAAVNATNTRQQNQTRTSTMKIIISGGGTGGHVFPAIAIADAIKKLRPDADLLFVGAEGKLEMEKVPKAGYPIEGLWISGFQRSLTLRNLMFPVKLIHSWWKARQIVRRFRPDVAVGVGGYASGPTLNATGAFGIPTVLQEQNSYPGVTNKILAKKAAKICVAYDGMEQFFPKEKIVLAGNPVRSEVFQNLENKRQEGITYFGLSETKQTIFVFGGSLGARTLNEALAAGRQILNENRQVQVLWQCGRFYHENFKNSETAQLPTVKILPFIDRMDLAYAAADVVIGRAGALSISEMCLVGKPSILVPSPNVAEDHQTKNALALVEKDAALMVKDAAAKDELIWTALEVLKNKELQTQLSKNIKALAKPDAAEAIANVVLNLIKK
jgi:UDP-N-acetylglucosamine--N-acetylmuramyl-(pentapeptide) pyrophosphoryl-undecaprenol N-acetylglucosamine transferase